MEHIIPYQQNYFIFTETADRYKTYVWLPLKMYLHSMRLFCKGVPVRMILLLDLIEFIALETAEASFFSICPSSQITKSGPEMTEVASQRDICEVWDTNEMPSHGGVKCIHLTPNILPRGRLFTRQFTLTWHSQPSIQYKYMCNLCCWPAHHAERDLVSMTKMHSVHVAFFLDVHFWMVSYMDSLKSRQTGRCHYFGFTLEERIHTMHSSHICLKFTKGITAQHFQENDADALKSCKPMLSLHSHKILNLFQTEFKLLSNSGK